MDVIVLLYTLNVRNVPHTVARARGGVRNTSGITPKRQARGEAHLGLHCSHRVPQRRWGHHPELSSVATADAKLVVATADAERVVAIADAKNASTLTVTPNASVIGIN